MIVLVVGVIEKEAKHYACSLNVFLARVHFLWKTCIHPSLGALEEGLQNFSPRTLRIWLLRTGGRRRGKWDWDSSFLLSMSKWKLYSRKLTRSTTKGDPIGKRKDIDWFASFKQARRKLLAQQ
ncbi:hypothetical protein D5086_010085 [Populus alba]|uniref:Uncharacterized protein n=2 Tax=Populus alba TaxID=43335 RepID=A0ACC4C8C8_POPAL